MFRFEYVNCFALFSFSIGLQSLETAWALSDRNGAPDLVEWMERLSIELIRQSPSPIIRYCSTLAKAHRSLGLRFMS